MVLNNTPSPSLGDVAPVTAMTGPKEMGSGDHITLPGPVKTTTIDKTQTTQQKHVVKLQKALPAMHKRSG
ncbi:hypothetical protein PI124_g7387 [Phytophthora idaei]|nr:hypothetical protein PI126_g7173 [Phytophthora idaei]KAG3247919.1 hypothetical protein PI124_g7387 [Phytophthora idaei]